MNTAKRTLLKLALVGTLAGSAIGMPLVASAAAEPNADFSNCHGVLVSQAATEGGGIGKQLNELGIPVRDAQQGLKFYCDLLTGGQ